MKKEDFSKYARDIYLSLPPEWQDRIRIDNFRVKYKWASEPTYFLRVVVDNKVQKYVVGFDEKSVKKSCSTSAFINLIEKCVLRDNEPYEELGKDCTTAGYELTW